MGAHVTIGDNVVRLPVRSRSRLVEGTALNRLW